MKLSIFNKLLFILTLCACQNINSKKESTIITSEQLYLNAAKMNSEENYDSALVLLNQAFVKGLQNPMRIVSDSRFYNLIDNPKHRQEVRVILKKFASDNFTTIVREDEPGIRISVTGKVLNENTKRPIENVIVEIVQADSSGIYFSENTTFNPRLFGYLKTDRNGQFTIHTIRPGSYLDDNGSPVPSHIHFTLEKSEFRTYASEFTFDDDLIFRANGNVDLVPVAIKKENANQTNYEVELNMQSDQ